MVPPGDYQWYEHTKYSPVTMMTLLFNSNYMPEKKILSFSHNRSVNASIKTDDN